CSWPLNRHCAGGYGVVRTRGRRSGGMAARCSWRYWPKWHSWLLEEAGESRMRWTRQVEMMLAAEHSCRLSRRVTLCDDPPRQTIDVENCRYRRNCRGPAAVFGVPALPRNDWRRAERLHSHRTNYVHRASRRIRDLAHRVARSARTQGAAVILV